MSSISNQATLSPVTDIATGANGNTANIDTSQIRPELQNLGKVTEAKENEATADKDKQDTSTQLSTAEVESVLEQLTQEPVLSNFGLKFAVDESSSRTIISIVDKDSGEVIRQIPSEEIQAIQKRVAELSDKMGELRGIIFNKEI